MTHCNPNHSKPLAPPVVVRRPRRRADRDEDRSRDEERDRRELEAEWTKESDRG
jgi:hypothetical protein